MYPAPRLIFVAIALSLAAAGVGALTGLPAIACVGIVDAALAISVVIDVWRAPKPQRLKVGRVAPNVTGIREVRQISVRVHNPFEKRLTVAIRDATPPSAARLPVRQSAAIPAGAWHTFEGSLTPARRGYADLGPVTVRVAGPLRLAGRQADVPPVERMKVYPALPGRKDVELRIDRARMLQSGQRSSAFRGGGTEFDSLREYLPDDEVRRINWRATARSAKPITNLYREERNQQIFLCYDASRMMAGNVGGLTRFEHALDAGFAVAELATHAGDQVGMVAFADRIEVMMGPRGGRDQARAILDSLFAIEPTLDAPDYQGAFAGLLAHHRRRSLLVLLTELTEQTAMESLFAALPVLLSRHLVIVGSITDPETETLAKRMPLQSEQVYLKAAAVQSLDARDRSAARLRAMGVAVEDKPPGKLSGALADRYLRIKGAGRL
jgi:uncharacterized protein (DUF58 family)